ncbi:MAG: DinB family protein [Phycisphaerales bacterium]|nr:DinB family protein [Phycisphaerales bacterium]
MVHLPTLQEWLRYSDWANERLLGSAEGLPSEQLDRRFDMGLGSLRRTLLHILAAESVWLQRWQGLAETKWPDESEKPAIPAIRRRFEACYAQRRTFLSALATGELARVVPYRDSKGTLYKASLGDMLLQVCVHSHHHRAQAINMLRRLGAAPIKPGLDYIFKKLEDGSEQPGNFDVATLLTFYNYGDWANDALLEASAALPDSKLDEPFEMGLGSLRKTLLHIRFAEQWWLENWTKGPGQPFPEVPEQTSIAALRGLWRSTRDGRGRVLAGGDGRHEAISRSEALDLDRIVEAHPRLGVVRRFPLGATMLQLCGHGVHHRAQAVNMLRRIAGAGPDLDYMYHVRAPAP